MYKNHDGKFRKLTHESKNLVSAKSRKITGAGNFVKNYVGGFRNHASNLLNHTPNIRKLVPHIPMVVMLGIMGLVTTQLRIIPSKADGSVVSMVNVTVQPSCTLSDIDDTSNDTVRTIEPGTYDDNIHSITITSNCNDLFDSQISAIGYTNDEPGNTDLVSADGSIISGQTPFQSNPDNFASSGWYMKVEPISTDLWQFSPQNNFSDFHTIPTTSTPIAKTTITTNLDAKPSSSIKVTYSIYASPAQAAGTYTGKVKYTLTTQPSGIENEYLYYAVAAMSRGTQSVEDLKAEITKENSGVYEYDPEVFGVASDASNDYKIYYYRGILDKTLGTYGSDGDGRAHPNYIRFAGYCWRIVRTTGSGGIKMIYNGAYGATTSDSCANTNPSIVSGNQRFNPNHSIVYVGYTYNNGYARTTQATSANTLFGTNSSYSGNNTNSSVKVAIEGTWYTSNMTSYTNKLEPSAGYCNDRSIYSNHILMSGDDLVQTPYATTQGVVHYGFGSRERTIGHIATPVTLNCPRGTVDIYTTDSANDGNRQLLYPAALLTSDEAALAGSGYPGQYAYNINSFLISGTEWGYWSMSPGNRYNDTYANVAMCAVGGPKYPYIHCDSYAYYQYDVRPAISLNPGTTITSGSGTAADPWIVE